MLIVVGSMCDYKNLGRYPIVIYEHKLITANGSDDRQLLDGHREEETHARRYTQRLSTRNCKPSRIKKFLLNTATGWTAQFRFQAWQDFSLLHSAQAGSGADPAFYPMGTGGIFPGNGAAGS
jgi:hypothetical protein